jgi:formylglycine-generating enzyme required for sulfatase activity
LDLKTDLIVRPPLAALLPAFLDMENTNASAVVRKPDRMVWIKGGTFMMGSDHHYPEEAPAHRVTVDGFWMDAAPVTNAAFRSFVDATGHVTSAERPANPALYPGASAEMLAPSSVVFAAPAFRVDMRNPYNWWTYVRGADWRHPRGPQTSIEGLETHPVVHVAYEDVEAYCAWAGKELPSEAEWEFAARGGLDGSDFPWGNELEPDGKVMANTWQGEFPIRNEAKDGFNWTSPVGYFPPNAYGLFDMVGNVWEWTSDWYQAHQQVSSCCGSVNPRIREAAGSHDPRVTGVQIPRKVMKGGSYLCAPNYCRRYRPAARMGQPIDTSTCHLGFRCIRRA